VGRHGIASLARQRLGRHHQPLGRRAAAVPGRPSPPRPGGRDRRGWRERHPHRRREVQPGRPVHVKAFPWPGSLLGLSPIAYAREAIGLGIGAEKYGAKLFGDSAIPSGVLTSDQRIDKGTAETLKERWEARHKGKRGIAVLGDGAKFQPITIAPDEAQFIQTQKFSVATICRFYGVPPEMMAGETAGHEAYTSPEMRGTDFLTFTLRRGCCGSSGPPRPCCRRPSGPSSTPAGSFGRPCATATRPTASPLRPGS
jgi:Phage portal protein